MVVAGTQDMPVQPLHVGHGIAQPHLGDDVGEHRRHGGDQRDRLTPPDNPDIRLDPAEEPCRPDPPARSPQDVFRERNPHEGMVDGRDLHRKSLFNERRVDLELSSNIIGAILKGQLGNQLILSTEL
jgi:hypothetical protein